MKVRNTPLPITGRMVCPAWVELTGWVCPQMDPVIPATGSGVRLESLRILSLYAIKIQSLNGYLQSEVGTNLILHKADFSLDAYGCIFIQLTNAYANQASSHLSH